MTDVYLALDYRAYKHLEDQLRDWERIETSHTSVNGYYHKALRLEIGDLTLEIQGPAVKAPPEPVEERRVKDDPLLPPWEDRRGRVVTNVGPDQQDRAHELAHEHARKVSGVAEE
jgi:hypothetical protein